VVTDKQSIYVYNMAQMLTSFVELQASMQQQAFDTIKGEQPTEIASVHEHVGGVLIARPIAKRVALGEDIADVQ